MAGINADAIVIKDFNTGKTLIELLVDFVTGLIPNGQSSMGWKYAIK